MIDFSTHPLVETDWLAEHLSEPNLLVVDARCWGQGVCRRDYLESHIPGAGQLCWHLDLTYKTGNVHHRILAPDRFAEVVAAAGIGGDTLVVGYDVADYSGAARLWWSLRYYGHEQVAVLNGGLTKWQAENRPMSTEIPQAPAAHFAPQPQPQWMVGGDEIDAILEDPTANVRFMDTRPAEQHAGQAVWTPAGSKFLPRGQDWVEFEGRKMRGGRIPGAVNLRSSHNLDPQTWTYRSPQALRARAQAVDIQPGQRVIGYCGVGVSAALGLFSLYLAGYKNLALYDASWEEWGSDPTRPVERDAPED